MSRRGVVAPARGWPGFGLGRASHVERPVEYQATTVQACGMFPFVAGSGAPTTGVPFGRHLLWGEAVCCDPFAWMDAGLTTNRGMFILGQPGTGKSAAGKRLTRGLMAFGAVPLFLGDAKPDYTALVRSAGGQVIRIGRGLDRINPLDAGPLGAALAQLSGAAAERVRHEVRGRRLAATLALCSLVRTDAPMTNAEEICSGPPWTCSVSGSPPGSTRPSPTSFLLCGKGRTGSCPPPKSTPPSSSPPRPGDCDRPCGHCAKDP